MNILRYKYNGNKNWGIIQGQQLLELSKPPFYGLRYKNSYIPLEEVKKLSPVEPSKVVLAGLNYKEHAKELGADIPRNPIIFIKPSTSVIGDGDEIVFPAGVERVDYEAELAIVINKKTRNISESQVGNHILGYTCLNDVTARNIQHEEGQWTRAKSFDTFCPIGSWISTDVNPGKVKIRSYLNGDLKQESETSDFIFPIKRLVSFISRVMTLNPGDVVSTGTPAGIGPMNPGDVIEVNIEGIGTLRNQVVAENK